MKEIKFGITFLMLMLFGFIIYSCVQVNKINKRIDTTQQLIMEMKCPLDEKIYSELHEIRGYLGPINVTVNQILDNIPSYIYRTPDEYDGIMCDDGNYCRRYIFLDDHAYNNN